MTYAQLKRAVSLDSGATVATVEKVSRVLFETLRRITLERGGTVTVPGFGTFRRGEHAARRIRDLATGELVTVAKQARVKFSAGKAAKR